jgi:hypothetical protein
VLVTLPARASFTSLQFGRPAFSLVLDEHVFQQLLDNGLLFLGHVGDGLKLHSQVSIGFKFFFNE